MTKTEYGLCIDGEFRAPSEGGSMTTMNPANGEQLAKVGSAGKADVNAAALAARRAFPGWRDISPAERAGVLLNAAERVEKHGEELSRIESADTGRPLIETREDVAAFADLFRYFAGVVRTEEDRVVHHHGSAFSMIVREPYGVAALIVPWNFPFLIAGWKLAPALAAGNAVILKPASATPLSALRFAELTVDLFPPGVLNVVTGSGSVCGDALVRHPEVDKIAFTGSTEVGRGIAAAAAERVVPVTLELGGKSANIVFPDAPMDKAVEASAMAILYSQGQVCCAGSRLLLHEAIRDEFLGRLVKEFEKVKIGDPLQEDVRMGPVIDARQLDAVLSYVQKGQAEGARLLYGGKRLEEAPYEQGFFMEPTIFTDVKPDMCIAQEEIFGPVLAVTSFRDEAEAIEIANNSVYGLAGAVWTTNIARAVRVAKAVEAGTIWVNEYNLVPTGSPFGGYKQSGYGREVHKMALENYSRIKSVYVNIDEQPFGWYDR